MGRGPLLLFILCAVNVASAAKDPYELRIDPDTFFGEENRNNTRFYERIISQHYEYPGYDGWFNNRAHPEWGAADTAMNRKLPHAYRDGSYQPAGRYRPSPMEISRKTMTNEREANYPDRLNVDVNSLGTGLKSFRDRSAFLVFFGQQVVEEVLDAQRGGCPPEYFNISVPHDHHLNPQNLSGWHIPLTRSRYDMTSTGYSPNTPREQLNEITPYIDGTLMYGAGKTWADALRSFHEGKLKSTLDSLEDTEEWGDESDYPARNRIRLPLANPPPPRDHRLKNVDRFFMLGNPRGNENPFLLTFGVFWYRYHNRLAEAVVEKLKNSSQYQSLSEHDKGEFFEHYDEKIFNEVRKWVVATHQKIVTYDWLPSWLATEENGRTFQVPPYKGYEAHVHPQIVHVFQSAAMRFGHTLVPPGVRRRLPLAKTNSQECVYVNTTDKTSNSRWHNTEYDNRNRAAVRTCNAYWNPQEAVTEHDIDALMLGMSSTITEREDTHITPDLRGFVFGGLDFTRRDLMAVNIQRARDHGLPDYNTARREYGLPVLTNWTQINPVVCGTDDLIENDPECFFIQGLKELYGDMSDIDIWPGGLAETSADGPGPLFRAVIGDQFERIRDGDRFWFENKNNRLFDEGERKALWNIRIRDIVKMVSTSKLEDKELSYNPFFVNSVDDRCQRLEGRWTQLLELSNAVNLTSECSDLVMVSETSEDDDNALMQACLDFTDAARTNLENRSSEFTDEIIQRLSHSDYAPTSETRDQQTAEAIEWLLQQFVDCPAFAHPPPCAMDPVDGENATDVEPCTPLELFDYFTGSEAPFILTFLAVGVFLIGNVVLLVVFARLRQRYYQNKSAARKRKEPARKTNNQIFPMVEWVGPKEGTRLAQIKLDEPHKALVVCDSPNVKKHLRYIDLNHLPNSNKSVFLRISSDKGMRFLLIRVPKEYDLVAKFENSTEAQQLANELKSFFNGLGITCSEPAMIAEKQLLAEAQTKAKRQKLLEAFFRSVFSRAFRWEEGTRQDELDSREAQEVIGCELTKSEFADALSLTPDSMFVENMFSLIDKDGNGFVSFREFLDMIVIFSKGRAEEKTRLLFDMYDVSGNGKLSRDEFKMMLKSMMDMASATVAPEEMEQLIGTLLSTGGMSDKTELTFEDFQVLLKDHEDALGATQLNFTGIDAAPPPSEKTAASIDRGKTMVKRENAPTRARKTVLRAYKDDKAEKFKKRASRVQVEVKKPEQKQVKEASAPFQVLNRFLNEVENHRLQIFWASLYTLVTAAIFAERAYYYSIEREFAGLRRIAGYGVTVTRGAASAMMFTYSCLLVTMCRNTITFLRETFLNRFIPFDSAVSMHKLTAYYAAFFTVIHTIGHGINFYHISTQTPADLTCLFRDYFRATHILPKFHYWCWNTVTGFTGVLATLLCIVMYVYATQYARRNLFRAFWITHNMYVVLFFLIIFHGAGMIVQPPFFYYFFLGPVILFTLDKLVSLSRNKVEISVFKAELLPSEVTGLTFKRPPNFEYRSGQWVRIACLALGEGEYHPFTLSSAPHEDNLTLHIRAVGPWTTNLRMAYDPQNIQDKPYPKLYLDGPFGEGHQDWFRFEVSVLVGGGIGVTPFASILKDIVQKSALGSRFTCKKVYFLWVTRTQKQYEWLVDIIREVEEKDEKDFVSVHLFVTQFQQKFDLRTTMLYICERHFQKVSNRSLFTGLRSITHFGRPNFDSFFRSLIDEHVGVSQVGVFSCGPPQMTHGVEQACAGINKTRTDEDPAFYHHFENF